jgi:hypothetical protein
MALALTVTVAFKLLVAFSTAAVLGEHHQQVVVLFLQRLILRVPARQLALQLGDALLRGAERGAELVHLKQTEPNGATSAGELNASIHHTWMNRHGAAIGQSTQRTALPGLAGGISHGVRHAPVAVHCRACWAWARLPGDSRLHASETFG